MADLIEDLVRNAADLTLADVGEKDLLRDYLLPLCREACGDSDGLGDDAAVLQIPPDTDIVVTVDRVPTDLLAARMGLMTPAELGAYLVRVNMSDIAAMGARPFGMVISCAFPRTTRMPYVLRLLDGLYKEAAAFGCPVNGGDTKSAEEQSLSATVLGVVAQGKAVHRGPVTPGMKLYLSGTVGHFGAALHWFSRTEEERERLAGGSRRRSLDEILKSRLVAPVPRLDLAHIIAESGCAGAMDITDGLIQSVREMLEPYHVGAVINDDSLHFADSTREAADLLNLPLRKIISGIGLDAELLVASTSNPDPRHFRLLGEITAEAEELFFADGEVALGKGFEHFQKDAAEYLR